MTDLYSILSISRIRNLLDNEPQYDNVSDIIADIMHYCDQNNQDFEVALRRARGYYEDDLMEMESDEQTG